MAIGMMRGREAEFKQMEQEVLRPEEIKMFAEDFMRVPVPCPRCGKVLTDGNPCINCRIIEKQLMEEQE